MDLMQQAAQALSDKLGLQVDTDTISSALTSLLGDSQGNVDLAGLAGKMASSGELGNVISSWLGDGDNAAISADSVLGLFDENRIADFAAQLGSDTDSAANGLSDVLPEIMDKSSSGGNLLDSLGGADGLLGMAKSLLS